MSTDKEMNKQLFKHWEYFLKLINTSHATKKEKKAIWSEFLTIYTGFWKHTEVNDLQPSDFEPPVQQAKAQRKTKP